MSGQPVLLSAVKNTQGLTADISPAEFENKHIIICASASGLVDLKSTPFTAINPYPGGEIHATLLSNLRFLRRSRIGRSETRSIASFSSK